MTCLAMTSPRSIRQIAPVVSVDQWRRDRLTEARSILADATRHPSSLVMIAARVVIGLTGDSAECAEAVDILRARDPRAPHAIAKAAAENGGVA